MCSHACCRQQRRRHRPRRAGRERLRDRTAARRAAEHDPRLAHARARGRGMPALLANDEAGAVRRRGLRGAARALSRRRCTSARSRVPSDCGCTSTRSTPPSSTTRRRCSGAASRRTASAGPAGTRGRWWCCASTTAISAACSRRPGRARSTSARSCSSRGSATLVEAEPWRFLRGCIRTDGCVFVNRTGRYEYLSYEFSNLSRDIVDLFMATCERLGLRPRRYRRYVRLYRREDVARLLAEVGTKS